MAINEEELMMQHSWNMMELDVIHKKLQKTLHDSGEDALFERATPDSPTFNT